MMKSGVMVKQVVSTLVLIYFARPRIWHTVKTNFIKVQTVDPEICSISILERSLVLVSPAHFVYDFELTDQINCLISLPGCLYYLRYWAICVIFGPVCDSINFKILTIAFLSSRFSKKSQISSLKCK